MCYVRTTKQYFWGILIAYFIQLHQAMIFNHFSKLPAVKSSLNNEIIIIKIKGIALIAIHKRECEASCKYKK